MKKILGIIVLFFILLIGGTVIYILMQQTKVTIDGHTFTVTVAKTESEKQKGLGGKTSLSENGGMLFPFSSPNYYSFWMKDMKIPIDILFIHNGHIVSIFKNVPPPNKPTDSLPTYTPKEPADAVLELAANDTDKFTIKEGDTVTVKNLNTK